MTTKPSRQIHPPKGKGTISSKIIKQAVKKVSAKRLIVIKKISKSPVRLRKK